MCGIFGLITTDRLGLEKKDFLTLTEYLFKLSESRGKEASGFITKSVDNISYYKTPETASKMIKSKEYVQHFKKIYMPASVIGHSRLVTNGSQEQHDNNQPVLSNNVVGVHNGIITNVEEIWNNHKSFEREYEIDTEIIFKLLGSLIQSVGFFCKAGLCSSVVDFLNIIPIKFS